MIIDRINNMELYGEAESNISKALKFMKEHDFSKDEKGVHKVDGDNLYYVVAEYQTKDLEKGFWESHKKYIDVHYMLNGQEKLLYSNFKNMEIEKDYNENDDAYILKGDSEGEVTIKEGTFVLCYPEDVHMTGIKVKDSEDIRKIIFKIAI
ncbi:YhcH/YjgK/YiaL family protein [Haloimpatiens lingqiaonensis]|uniref:YhcH/YjgK/YiaL family protein n=1 Tax=Haloimpatiens lingqiaonensis TaxID=1380675 RepID=UPI001485BE0B|nr:YhcH/YjgK/YiaL family protein [Haloimpatiens lingqiaonensis]